MGVEVFQQYFFGVVFEIAPIISNHCLAGANIYMAGKTIHRGLLFGREDTVHGLPFVILVFAHRLHTLQYLQDFIRPVDAVTPPAGDLTQQAGLNQLVNQTLGGGEIDL